MPAKQTLLKSARLFHLYSGVFLAPALLFFAFTGGVQTFSLHETTRGSTYKPPAILVTLAQLHKKQTIILPVRREPPPGATKAGTAGKPANEDKAPEPRQEPGSQTSERPLATTASTIPAATPTASAKVHNLWPMKIFFLICSVGLFFSTLTGLYMAYRFSRDLRVVSGVLAAGIVIPLLLLLF